MSQPALDTTFDRDAYLGWEEQQPDKHEYYHGEVFAMVGGGFAQDQFEFTGNPGSEADPWEATLLIEPSGECPNLIGGDLDMSGTPRMQPHPTANNLMVLAGRDIEVSGTPGMFMTGLLAAHEQVYVNGNPTVHEGGFIAEEACNSINDLIDTTIASGNTTVSNSGPVETPIMGLVPHTVLVAWDEI